MESVLLDRRIHNQTALIDDQQAIIDRINNENRSLKKKLALLQQDNLVLTYEIIDIKRRYEVMKAQPIDRIMLRRIKQLCHPDKHNNSELSTSVMKFLNAL